MEQTRRRFLVGVVGAAAGLAGCAGSESEGGATTDSPTATTTATTDTTTAADATGASATASETTATATTTTATATTTSGPAWLTAELTDVTTGKTFTVAGLAAEKPVLLEPFAVWCSTCTYQQQAVSGFHDKHPDLAHSVSLNIDPNERRDAVIEHVEKHGFEWRYAVAPGAVSASLRSDFGPSVLNAPLAPMVVVCAASADAASRLKDGVKGTETLRSAVEGC
ncbi:MAG: TlpA family protein disulfide reductase [Halobacteriaceae archaeon]